MRTDRKRDTQRSKVYAWEMSAIDPLHWISVFENTHDASEWIAPIWRAERGRVGLSGQLAPTLVAAHGRQRRPKAHSNHRITLPKWATSHWVLLHELAHRLTPGDGHGPRFVGVLIGLGCRYLDLDAQSLMASADAGGVKYSVRSIGRVPVHGPAWHVERAITDEGPMTAIDLSSWLNLGCGVDITPLKVRGAALSLIRSGRARWLRGKLTALGPVVPH
jgi:hypothetical protein